MRVFRSLLLGLVLAIPVPAPGIAAAEPQSVSPGEALDTALTGLLSALREMLDALPRYAPPELTENGDIVIRRLPPDDPAPHPPRPPSWPESERT